MELHLQCPRPWLLGWGLRANISKCPCMAAGSLEPSLPELQLWSFLANLLFVHP